MRLRECPTAISPSAASNTRAWSIEDMGVGWQTDYPFSERNLMTRLSELTKTPISRDDRATNRTPGSSAPPIRSSSIARIVVASDAGTIGLKPDEVLGLRDYLLKGGFLWVDDFWGTAAWEQWSTRNRPRAAAVGVSHQGCAVDRSAAADAVPRDGDSADHEHPVLAGHTGARTRRSAAPTAPRRTFAPFAIGTAASWC